jgi:hypothetical protein
LQANVRVLVSNIFASPGDAACVFRWIEDLAAAGIAEVGVSEDGFCFCILRNRYTSIGPIND